MAPGAGALLAGLEYPDLDELDTWLQARRSEQRARRAKAFEEAITQAEAEQRLGDAIACARQQLADEPSAEVHHRTLIRLHYLDQDMARARSAFQALQQMLEEELGASPSAETLALMRLVDECGSRGLAPARVWATALQRPPRLVGRVRELQALRQALADRRALLLLGEAGMGKSRLLAEGLESAAGHVLVKAQAGDAGVPYATLARLLRRLLEQQRVTPEPGALARLLPEIGPVVTAALVPLPADGERLVLQAAAIGDSGQVLVLDMGEPVKIVDLARDLIRMAGHAPQEIAIEFTGLRPGEKLYEELLADEDATLPTAVPRLRIARLDIRPQRLDELLSTAGAAGSALEDEAVRDALARSVPGYHRTSKSPNAAGRGSAGVS